MKGMIETWFIVTAQRSDLAQPSSPRRFLAGRRPCSAEGQNSEEPCRRIRSLLDGYPAEQLPSPEGLVCTVFPLSEFSFPYSLLIYICHYISIVYMMLLK